MNIQVTPFSCLQTIGSSVQALRVPSIRRLARSRRAASRARPSLAAALSPESRAAARRWRGLARAGGRGRARGSRTTATAAGGGADLALDEGERLLAVLRAVALVHVGVVSRAAVRIGRVAVRLDLAGVGADEPRGASVELRGTSVNVSRLFDSGLCLRHWSGRFRRCMAVP